VSVQFVPDFAAALAGLTERHLDLLRALWSWTEPGTATARVEHAALAEAIGLKGEPKPGRGAQGSRQVRRLMAELYRRGLVVVLDPEQFGRVPGPSGGARQGANCYELKVSLGALPLPVAATPQVRPLGHGEPAGVSARTSAGSQDHGDGEQLLEALLVLGRAFGNVEAVGPFPNGEVPPAAKLWPPAAGDGEVEDGAVAGPSRLSLAYRPLREQPRAAR